MRNTPFPPLTPTSPTAPRIRYWERLEKSPWCIQTASHILPPHTCLLKNASENWWLRNMGIGFPISKASFPRHGCILLCEKVVLKNDLAVCMNSRTQFADGCEAEIRRDEDWRWQKSFWQLKNFFLLFLFATESGKSSIFPGYDELHQHPRITMLYFAYYHLPGASYNWYVDLKKKNQNKL